MQNTLFLMARHGHTPLNDTGMHDGWSEVSLDDKGRQEARETGAFLSKLPFNIKTVIVSDLDRTRESATVICHVLGIPEFELDSRLRDLDTEKESIDEFNLRQYNFATELLTDIESGKIEEGSVLLVTSSPIISYWVQVQQGRIPDDYKTLDDTVLTGGIVLVTDDTVLPIHNRNTGTKMPLSDGTSLAGFVTALENRPPRECWACKWSKNDTAGSLVCGHPLVNIDPELQDRRTTEGTTLVEPDSCCNSFQANVKP